MTLDELTAEFDHAEGRSLLACWRWLIGDDKRPVLVTIAGDAFVQEEKDGSVHFLDTVDGDLSHVAASIDEFALRLRQERFVADFFRCDTVAPLLGAGVIPGPGEVLSYEMPPALGGELSSSNLQPTDMAVHFAILGQIFEQSRGLPPGTRVAGFEPADS